MPAGCKECSPGQWQCGSDVNELCASAGGWTPAGALCLQIFVRKHPQSGNCLVRVELKGASDCGESETTTVEIPVSPALIARTLVPAKKKAGIAKRKK
jgi:hypothetical protein